MDVAGDAGVFLSDLGVPAVSGLMSGQVLLDKPDEDILNGNAVSREYMITFALVDFPSLVINSAITVAGVAYTLREHPHVTDDGVFAVVRLKKT